MYNQVVACWSSCALLYGSCWRRRLLVPKKIVFVPNFFTTLTFRAGIGDALIVPKRSQLGQIMSSKIHVFRNA